MATRTELIPYSFSFAALGLAGRCGGGRRAAGWTALRRTGRCAPRPVGVVEVRHVAGALGVDEVAQPAHLAFDRLEAVLLQLERVAVEALPSAGHRLAHTVEPFLQAR